VTEAGVRNNVSVAIQYLSAWLQGSGAVAIFNLMEDAATAEISRTQVWQWIRHKVALDDGRTVDPVLLREIADEEMARIEKEIGPERFPGGRFQEARDLFERLSTSETLEEFLTIPAYERLEPSRHH
jgi:malate synthase